MKIISHKNIKYNFDNFLNSTINNSVIDGVLFDIIMTKDKKILIYTTSNNDISNIDYIQNNNYSYLKNIDVLPLEVFLQKFVGSSKKIILNLLPIVANLPSTDNIQNSNQLNQNYVLSVQQVIEKFPTLEFYLCSAYDNLVYQLKNIDFNNKIGFMITNLSTSYIDVDFYIFTINVVDEIIINQQLSLQKEVMLYLTDCNDMSILMKDIEKRSKTNTINASYLNDVYFISDYPELFWKLFS